MPSDDWCVIVFKCKSNNIMNVIVDLYDFVKNVEDIKSLHFLIRDRVNDEVIISFRILIKTKDMEILKSKIVYKLKTLIPEEKFAVDPNKENHLYKYIAWTPQKRIKEQGYEKFVFFYNFLGKMSDLIIKMIKSDYFNPEERNEIAHVMSWMLGCTEYGKLSKQYMEVGYYDRISDKYYTYLKAHLTKTNK